MSSIRPSADKPVVDYYFQPWWVREAGRIAEILSTTDVGALSAKDRAQLRALAKAVHETIGEKDVQV